MNKLLGLGSLISISFLGFVVFPANGQIPQTGIQEILIEGIFNEVNQQLNQTLNLNFVYLPEIAPSVIPNFNIQGAFLDNDNNQLNQQINQNVLDFTLVDTSLTDFSVEDFLNHDNTLNGVQYISQQAFIDGNSNIIIQQSSQFLTDFFFLDQSSGITGDENFSQFLDKLLTSQGLDSLQFGLQDAFIFGNNNLINQTINQTFNSFIVTTNDFSPLFDSNGFNSSMGLDPIQFTIQEIFINDSKNNSITQIINQTISDVFFFTLNLSDENFSVTPHNSFSSVETNNSVEFDIDAFIEAILNDIIVTGTQINRQVADTIGNDNEAIQENVQVLIVSVPEPSSLKMLLLLASMGISGFLRQFFERGCIENGKCNVEIDENKQR